MEIDVELNPGGAALEHRLSKISEHIFLEVSLSPGKTSIGNARIRRLEISYLQHSISVLTDDCRFGIICSRTCLFNNISLDQILHIAQNGRMP